MVLTDEEGNNLLNFYENNFNNLIAEMIIKNNKLYIKAPANENDDWFILRIFMSFRYYKEFARFLQIR